MTYVRRKDVTDKIHNKFEAIKIMALESRRLNDRARSVGIVLPGKLTSIAIQRLIDDERKVDSRRVKGWWKDTGQLEDILEANRLVLEEIKPAIDGELVDSRVEGRVVIEKGAVLERSLVRGPAIIGAGSRISDAYIGPYTAIANGVTVSNAEIEHSILLDGSSVSDLGTRMEASLLGRDSRLHRGDGLPRTLRLVVGDNSEIAIP